MGGGSGGGRSNEVARKEPHKGRKGRTKSARPEVAGIPRRPNKGEVDEATAKNQRVLERQSIQAKLGKIAKKKKTTRRCSRGIPHMSSNRKH